MKTVLSPLMMNQMRRILLSIGALVTLVSPLQAQTGPSAQDLVTVCREAEKILDGGGRKDGNAMYAGSCLGYFEAVLATHSIYQLLFDRLKAAPGLERMHAFFCTDNAVNSGEAMKVFLKYMKDHPEKLHENKHMTVLDASVEAFPCKP